jgi:hypothetical protein
VKVDDLPVRLKRRAGSRVGVGRELGFDGLRQRERERERERGGKVVACGGIRVGSGRVEVHADGHQTQLYRTHLRVSSDTGNTLKKL